MNGVPVQDPRLEAAKPRGRGTADASEKALEATIFDLQHLANFNLLLIRPHGLAVFCRL